jgi:hypothetical protein
MYQVNDKHAPVSVDVAKELLGKWTWINQSVVTPERLAQGMTVEREHGRLWNQFTDVGGDSDEVAAKIALAHMAETPDYYDRLAQMEREFEAAWEGRKKPSIFALLANE